METPSNAKPQSSSDQHTRGQQADENSHRETINQLIEKREQLKKYSVLLDDAFVIPGTQIRVGWDAIIGLVPVVGDTIGGLLSAVILFEASKLNVPKPTLLRMLGNVGVEFIVGLVPVIGDLFDVSWRANKMNYEIIDKHINKELMRLGRADLTDKVQSIQNKLSEYQLPLLVISSLLLLALVSVLVF